MSRVAIVEFLSARLDEDEQAARQAGGAPWVADVPGMVHVDPAAIAESKWAYGGQGYIASCEHAGHQAHIARHDPERVLAEVKAKREIVELHMPRRVRSSSGLGEDHIEVCRMCDQFPAQHPCGTLRALAAPYADHPDYRKEWAP